MTAVEWLAQQIQDQINCFCPGGILDDNMIEQAKAMEKEEIHKRQLMLGKVSELIGFEKTVELWKECIETIENRNHETE